MKSRECNHIVRQLRIGLGYTQTDVASWINTDRSNYTKKEKGNSGGVTLTADEFLTILKEFLERGPGPKAKKYLSKETDELLRDTSGLAGALIKLASHKKGYEKDQPASKEGVEKMLDRYEKLISNYIHMIDSLQNRVTSLETFITSNNDRIRKGDPKYIKIGRLRRHP